MIPVLYDEALPYTGYTSPVRFLGKGKLTDVISCSARQEINGEFTLEFQYPITGPAYTELVSGGTVLAIIPRTPVTGYTATRGFELFDIKKKSTPIDGVVTFTAYHCSRRLTGSVFTQRVIGSQGDWNISNVWEDAVPSHQVYPGTTSEKTVYNGLAIDGSLELTNRPIPLSAPKSSLACLLGEEESVANLGYEVYFFCTSQSTYEPTLHVTFQNAIGEDRGAAIRFGVNMLDVDHVKDFTEAFNAVVPYWDDGNGNITYATGYVVQPTTPISPVIAVPLDCSDAFETAPTSAQLTTYARTFLDSKTPWTGTETIKVDFVNGAEIDPHAPDILLGDTIHVYWGDADIATDLRVVAYDYDVLAERYISLELGTPQTQYVAVTGESYAGASASGGISKSDYLFYDSVGDLGLESGSATISAAYSAMPNRAIFIGAASQFSASEVPNIYGIVQIIKFGDQRASIHFFGKQRGNADYRKFFVGDFLSGPWIKDVLTFYTVNELGITSGSATITQIWNAMPLQSRYIGGAGDIASSALPYSTAYGQVEIWKNTATNGYIFLHGLNASIGEWRMFLDNSGGSYAPSLTWVRLPGAVNNGTITKIDADTTDNGSSIKTDGHTAELHLMFRKSAGYTTNSYTDVFIVSPPPKTAVQQLVAQNSSYGLVIINTSGTVRVYPYSGTLSGHIRITVPYFV